jgi:uncharacterized protein
LTASFCTVEVGDSTVHTLHLLPERAAFLPDTSTLLIADAHIGKAVSFRALGVPVPAGTTTENLNLISLLVTRHQAQRIIFLGDFLHSAKSHAAATMAAVSTWRELHANLQITLVRGNHDDRAGDPPAHLRVEVVDEPLRVGGLALCHHPQEVADAYVLAGHLHPCVKLAGRGRESLRLPCFWMGPRAGVLPAFGAFTGMAVVKPLARDQVFAVAGDSVLAVTASRFAPSRPTGRAPPKSNPK